MLGRIKNRKSRSSRSTKSQTYNFLTQAIIRNSVEIPNGYSSYIRRGLKCESSPADSSRYLSCVTNYQSGCDIGFLAKALLDAAAYYYKLEAEIEEIKEKRREIDKKVSRLRKQKKIQYKKMTRAIQRSFASVEEIERVEREEAAEEERRRVTEAAPSTFNPLIPSSNFTDD